MSITAMKNKSASNLDKYKKEAEKLKSSNSYDNDNTWYPDVDKNGNGMAIIRFLPTPAADELIIPDAPPFVLLYSRGFKNEHDEWYIENDLSTLKQKDPLGALTGLLYKTGSEDDKEIAKKLKRKTHYYSNILIIDDKITPENNGKVKLYKYGKKIWDKIDNAMNPPTTFGEKPIVPFDFWTGANFILKITTDHSSKEKFRKYDESRFEAASVLSEDDNYLESIYSQCVSLQKFIAPNQFKDYDTLLAKLNEIWPDDFEHRGGATGKMKDSKKSAETPDIVTKTEPKKLPPKKEAPKVETLQETLDGDSFDSDDEMAALAKLADM